MTSAEERPTSDEQLEVNSVPDGPAGSGDEALEGGAGIGATTTDEPDTFEPEEPE